VFVGSLHLKIYRCPAKNRKKKLAGNAAKTPNIITEISIYTQKFPANKIDIENIFLTFLRLIYKLKNKWKWLQKIIWQRKEIMECNKTSRVDSSSNTIPSETFDVTCKNLVKHMQHGIDRYLEST
jgi:hypothetical protein